MTPYLLIRPSLGEEDEQAIAQEHFPHWGTSRMQVPPQSLVVARYCALPFYQELETDLAFNGSRLVNTHAEHKWIANIMDWAGPQGALAGLTPATWDTWYHLPEGAYVLKGRTNSRKFHWATQMYAPNKAAIGPIARVLSGDSLIGDQGIVIREYVPLKALGEGLNGLPITNEWRTFWYRDTLLAKGYYWASHPELIPDAQWTGQAETLAYQAARIVSRYATFFVLDLAETAEGSWVVIEVNDGQMSGPSCCDLHELYSNLSRCLQQ